MDSEEKGDLTWPENPLLTHLLKQSKAILLLLFTTESPPQVFAFPQYLLLLPLFLESLSSRLKKLIHMFYSICRGERDSSYTPRLMSHQSPMMELAWDT